MTIDELAKKIEGIEVKGEFCTESQEMISICKFIKSNLSMMPCNVKTHFIDIWLKM